MPRVRRLSGSIDDPALLARAFDTPVDVVFHLASVPGGSAELNYELGRQVNVDATINLESGPGTGDRRVEAARIRVCEHDRGARITFDGASE